jgi:hypothetical protein
LKVGIALLTLLLIGLLLVPSEYVLAQSAPLKIQWSKTYGSGGASGVIQTQDGGFVILGANATRLPTVVFTMYNYTSLLIKTNSAGEVEWIKTYPGTNGIDWITQTTDSDYLLLGHGSYSSWLLETDSQGNIEWNRTINLQQTMGFTATEDGSYIIVGYAENPVTAYNYAVVLKYNANGDLLWQKTVQEDKINVAATVILQSDNSSSYYVAGSWNQSFWFVKLNSDGNIVWNQTYNYQDTSGISPLTFHSIAQTQDNGYILGGTDGKYAWLVETDSDGNEQWHRRYDCDNFISVAQEKTGQYVAFSHLQIVSMDIFGNELWNESYNDAETSESSIANSTSTYAASGIVSNDGSLVVVGSANDLIDNTYDFWAAKFVPESATPPGETSPPSPTTLIVIAVIILAVAGVSLLVYFKKHKRRSAA